MASSRRRPQLFFMAAHLLPLLQLVISGLKESALRFSWLILDQLRVKLQQQCVISILAHLELKWDLFKWMPE